MTMVHAALAWLAAASTIALLIVATAAATRLVSSGRLLDRAVLLQLVVSLLAAASGVVAFAAAPPRDALHLLYGVLVPALPPAARAAAQGRDRVSRARWVAAATLVAVGVTVRAFMTGG